MSKLRGSQPESQVTVAEFGKERALNAFKVLPDAGALFWKDVGASIV